MKFERKNLADLHPAEYNPRKKLTPNDPEYIQIRNSLTEFGYADPIVINSDGTIIKGHQRCTVMMDLGYTEAEVIVLDIPDKAKEKALNIALNKITGKWDNAILKDLFLKIFHFQPKKHRAFLRPAWGGRVGSTFCLWRCLALTERISSCAPQGKGRRATMACELCCCSRLNDSTSECTLVYSIY